MHPSGPGAQLGTERGAVRRAERAAASDVRRAGRRRGRTAAAVLVPALVLGGAGYAAADAADRVPGVLTTDPLPVPDPLPVAPGALVAPAPATALPAPAGEAPAPDPAVLAAAVGPLLADPALGPSVGASVVDAATGRVLLDVAAGPPREPASTAKLLTGAAALHRLGGATTLPTTVVAGAAPGEVVLVGAGDVLLGPGAGDPTATLGRAGLGDLAAGTAAALRASGTSAVTVLVDDTLTAGAPLVAPGWAPSDLSAGFVAPVSALALDAGRLAPENYAPRAPDPALAAAAAFADRLREQGVAVAAAPARGAAPAGAAVLAEVRSAPLADVVGLMLVQSDNTVAEVLARLVGLDAGALAPGTGAEGFAAAGAAVLAAAAELGVAVDGAVLVDASGLGDGSLVPAAALAGVLARAASPDGGAVRPLLTGLPVAGLTGTLAGRFRGPAAPGSPAGAAPPAPGAGVVRAKTGSLLGVTSLAGSVVDADGRHLVFAVVADRAGPAQPSRPPVDAVAAALARCRCP